MPLQMLAVQLRADCANNVLGASTWCAQTIIMGGTSATEIPMAQRPATVIAAIALKYALHEAHLSESEIGFSWMRRPLALRCIWLSCSPRKLYCPKSTRVTRTLLATD